MAVAIEPVAQAEQLDLARQFYIGFARGEALLCCRPRCSLCCGIVEVSANALGFERTTGGTLAVSRP
jgi:hypothetical protein